MNPPEPGWYRDPYFKNRERYWDGEIWTDECRLKQPALGAGGREGAGAATAGAGAATAGRHERVVRPDPVTAQQPAVTKDPDTTQPPADTQPVRIFTAGVAGGAGAVHILGGDAPVAAGSDTGTRESAAAPEGAAAESDPSPTKAEAAANAERVRTIGAAALLGGDIAPDRTATDGAPPPTRRVKTPKEPPPEATRRVSQEADPLLGVSMPGTISATATTATTTAVAPEEQASKSHRRGLIIAIAAVVVVLAGLGVYLGLNHHSPKGGVKGDAGKNATAAAASTTIHQKTAHVAISTKLSSALGQTDGPSAVGDFNLSKNEGSMTVTAPGSPTPVPVVFQKKTIYVNLGGALSAVLPGKTWVSASILQISSQSAGVNTSLSSLEQMVGNPQGLLRQLKVGGNKIVSIGNSSFDGTAVQGYTVTLSSKALTKSADLVPASHTTETVYVAKSGGQIKAIVVPTTVNSAGQLVNQNVYVTFSNFGAPVSVTVPPASETVTLAQYQAALGKPSTLPTTAPIQGGTSGASSPGLG